MPPLAINKNRQDNNDILSTANQSPEEADRSCNSATAVNNLYCLPTHVTFTREVTVIPNEPYSYYVDFRMLILQITKTAEAVQTPLIEVT